MATIKSYSDLQQSKVLAEILPLESADMYYDDIVDRITGELFIPDDGSTIKVGKGTGGSIAAWSLAALISIIPQEIFDGEYIINITEGIDNKWIITYDHHENKNHSYYGLSTGADNLVDACTDIIIKLKERNII